MPKSNKPNHVNQVPWKDKKLSLSSAVLLVLITGSIFFIAGTRSEYIYSAIAPVFGYKISSSSIDLSDTQLAYRMLRANFDGDLDAKKLQEGSISGLVAEAGDPYTTYLTASQADEFDRSLNGRVSGVGIEIGVRSGQPTVLRTIDNSPAKEAGLLAGDVLIKVGDRSIKGGTPADAAKYITGEAGTTVKLSVLRGEETKEFSMTRREVSDPSVAWSTKDDIGILRIRRFDSDTGDLARRAGENFIAKKVKAVILDLRDNGGGLLDQSQSVAGLWLDNQLVLKETSRHSADKKLFSTGKDAILASTKTIILANGGTASASEIVAGALRDHKKATIIGEQSFGKGTVQQVMNMNNGGQLKVTIAHWYTPNGVGIAKKGISPDKKVELTLKDADAGNDPQMQAALDSLK